MSFLLRPTPEFTGKEVLKLLRGDELIGTITNLDMDWPLHEGDIQLTDAAAPYKHIWEFWTIEGNRAIDPPFEIPEDLDENWFIEAPSGDRVRVDFPAVYSDGSVIWQPY